MTRIDPGRMRTRIEIWSYTPPQGGLGNPATFDLITRTWCQYRPTSGRDFRSGSIASNEERATFSIQHREGIKPADYVIFRGFIYHVVALAPVGWKEGLDLHCRTVWQQWNPPGGS
jgi:head-tail adaptor